MEKVIFLFLMYCNSEAHWFQIFLKAMILFMVKRKVHFTETGVVRIFMRLFIIW